MFTAKDWTKDGSKDAKLLVLFEVTIARLEKVTTSVWTHTLHFIFTHYYLTQEMFTSRQPRRYCLQLCFVDKLQLIQMVINLILWLDLPR